MKDRVTINLRPHHLLCIQKFTGHGYDIKFTNHLTRIVARFSAHPGTRITLTEGCDAVCRLCPNQNNGACLTSEKVRRMDNSVLEICGLKCGTSTTWAELSHRARKEILETERFDEVCGSCQWYELCKRTEAHNEEGIEDA